MAPLITIVHRVPAADVEKFLGSREESSQDMSDPSLVRR